MSGASSIPFWTMSAGWAQVVVLIITARLVWRYLHETERLREAAQEQLEGQIRPAIVVRHGSGDGDLELVNVGKGPALHIRLSTTERGSAGKPGLDPMADPWFVASGDSYQTPIRAQGAGIFALNGRSLQCEYTSLSGQTYWTVVGFDKFDNTRLMATRFY